MFSLVSGEVLRRNQYVRLENRQRLFFESKATGPRVFDPKRRATIISRYLRGESFLWNHEKPSESFRQTGARFCSVFCQQKSHAWPPEHLLRRLPQNSLSKIPIRIGLL